MQIIKNKIFTLFTLLFLLVFGGFTTEVWGQLYGKAVGVVSPSNAGSVRVSYNNSSFTGWSTTTTNNSGSGGNWWNSSWTFTMAFQASQSNDAYEFYGWYDNAAGTGNVISSNLNITQEITAKTKNGNNKSSKPATITRYAIFKAKPIFYFKATATTNNPTYGNAYVTFTETNKSSATTSESTTNCYGTHYNTASMTKTAYFRAAPKTGYVFKGWSTDNTEANIFNTATSITYDLTSSSKNSESPATIQYYAIFGERFAPQITGTASVDKKVGDSYRADFTFTNTSSATPSSSNTADFYYTITHELSTSVNNGTNVISYDPSTGAILALNAGKATIKFINKSTTTHQYKEVSFVVKVAKKEPSFSCGTSMKVDQNLSCTYNNTSATTPSAKDADNFYYVFTNNTPTGNVEGSDTQGSILTFSDNKVYGKNAGTATITFYQKETYMYSSANKAIEITVSKHEPVFHWNDEETTKGTPYYYNSKIYDIFSTSSPNEYSFDSKNPASAVAVKGTIDTLIIYNVNKSATITVKQKENYKYSAKSQDYVITPVKKNNHVTLTVNSSDVYNAVKGATQGDVSYTDNGIRLGGSRTDIVIGSPAYDWEDKYIDVAFEGIPEKVTFDIATNNNAATGEYWYVKESSNGSAWSDEIWHSEHEGESYASFAVPLSSTTRYIRLCYSGNFAGYVKDLTITELQHFKTATESLDFGDRNQLNVEPSSQSFVVKHANAGYQTTVTAPEHYRVSLDNSSFSELVVYSTNETKRTGGDIMGEFTVYVKYLADADGKHDGNIEVSNNLRESILVPVTATTLSQRDPVLIWNITESLRANTTYTNFVTSTNKEVGLNIAISNDNNGLLTVTCVNGVYVLTTGNLDKDAEPVTGLTITVSQDGTENYNAVEPQTITITLSPRGNVCLPLTEMNNDILKDMTTKSESSVEWCGTNNQGSGQYVGKLYTVYYTQRKGIALGSWKDGLSGFNFENFSYSTKSVVLSFTGVPDDIKFDVYSQHLRSVGNVTGATGNYDATLRNWTLEESADGVHFSQVGEGFESPSGGTEGTHIQRNLNSSTRYVRITYTGNFTGFVQNLQITRKRYLEADKSSLTFGDADERPLQEPQIVTLNYSSIGSCDSPEAIEVESTNDAFYVDIHTKSVGIDEMGSYEVRVRCTDVGKSGVLNFKVGNVVMESVLVQSATPELTSANSSTLIFRTGTEQPASENSPYRGITTYNFSTCFNAGTPRFDTLYIYGVSASAVDKRDSTSSWSGLLPAINLAEGNVHTPCFVYAKDNNRYVHTRTFDAATTTLNISVADKKKIAFMGYKPASLKTSVPAIQLNGNVGEQTELYLHNSEIMAKDAVLEVNSSSNANPYVAKLIINGLNNKFIANSNAAIQLSSNASKLVIAEGLGKLAIIPSSNKPSIDLGSANGSVEIKGSQVELHNAAMTISGHNVNMAIANMSGADKTTGSVAIKDGTITGASILGMPRHTIIDGGTFNDGTVKVYDAKGRAFPPLNTAGDLLARLTKTIGELPASGYGKCYLVDVEGTVYPLLEDPNICKFTGKQGTSSDLVPNWDNDWYDDYKDVVVKHNMDVVSNSNISARSLTINPGVTVTVKSGATLSVDSYSLKETAGNLYVENGGKIILNGELKVNNISIESKLGSTEKDNVKGQQGGTSGQILDESDLMNINGNTYFDISFDPSGKISYGWYNFTVPFNVNVLNGIYRIESIEDRLMLNGTDFIIYEADEYNRAHGGNGWHKMSNVDVLKPGKLYSITLNYRADLDQNKFRFVWNKEGSRKNGYSQQTQCSEGDVEELRGWNGIGNGMLSHGHLNTGYKAQIFSHKGNNYVAIDSIENYTFAVGTAFFIQVPENVSSISWTASEASNEHPIYYAPKRDVEETEEFRIALRMDGSEENEDVLFFSASEDAKSSYVIGHDLMKMGNPTEANVAQMWTRKSKSNYNLCDVEMPLVYGEASCPLNIYAPKQATYTLVVEQAPEDAELFLTYYGKVIWNLTSSPAEIVLNAGVKNDFGLILKLHNAPEIAEGVDNIDEDNHSVRKVLIDNTIYVITPDGAMYDVNGKLIR